MRKATSIAIGSAVLVAMAAAAAALAQVPRNIMVTQGDVAAAGFTGVSVQPAQANSFQPPVVYYKVDESAKPSGPEGVEAADIVAVMIQPISWDTSWLYNSGAMEILNYSGRTQARVSRPGYYIVVTGPDEAKVKALAGLLKEKG